MNEQNKCPVMHGGIKHTTFGVRSNRDWWPNQLNLKILHQNSALSNPMGPAFNYAEAFKTVDLDVLRQEIFALMTDSKEWWPADCGHYGPLFTAWPGTAPAHIAPVTGVAAPVPARCASPRSTAGPTTPTPTRRAVFCGRSSRNMARACPGPT